MSGIDFQPHSYEDTSLDRWRESHFFTRTYGSNVTVVGLTDEAGRPDKSIDEIESVEWAVSELFHNDIPTEQRHIIIVQEAGAWQPEVRAENSFDAVEQGGIPGLLTYIAREDTYGQDVPINMINSAKNGPYPDTQRQADIVLKHIHALYEEGQSPFIVCDEALMAALDPILEEKFPPIHTSSWRSLIDGS